VINPYVAWNMSLGSEWISGQPVANYSPDNCSADNCTCPPYLFQRCFCLCQDDSVTINFDVLHDDRMFINLVDQSNGNIIPIYDGCPNQNPGNYYFQVVRHVSAQLSLKAGRYCLEAHLFNTGGTAMGFSLEGAIQGVSIETDVCCDNTGSISGAKFHDKDCDGKRDISNNTFIDPGLPGWQIVLCDSTGNPVDTALTDVQGIYSFTHIPPGTYTVKEIQQAMWSPSVPAGGMQTVTVQPTGAVVVDFGNCKFPVTPCDSINAIAVKDTSKMGCCFRLTIDNQKPNYFSSLEISVLSGGTLDNATANSGWSVQNPGAATAWLYPTGGIIPTGTQLVGEFCLDNLNADSQVVEIKYFGVNGAVVCRDTLVLRCESCVEIHADPLVCKGRDKYEMTFCVQTGDNLDWNVNSIHIIAPAGVTVTPAIIPLPNIPKGTTACSWTVSITGALQPGTLCLTAVIHEQNILLEPELNCCSDTFCVEIPDCDPCDSSITYATSSSAVLDKESCCFDITLHNFPDYFVAVNTQITTPGWEFSAINNSPASGFIINTNTPPTSVWWDPTLMHNNYVPDGITLPTMCLNNTGGGTLPIDVLITWMAADQSICTYTLHLNCDKSPPPSNECVLLTSDSLICRSDTSYAYTFTVYNNSNLSKPPGFTAGQVTLYPVPAGTAFNPSTFNATIAPSSSQTFTTTVNGHAGDQICFYAVLHELNHDSLHINCCPTADTICITLPPCGFQCPNNLVQNGDFQQGMAPGDLGSGGTASFWGPIPNSTPQVALNEGCTQNGSILMWGNQVVGEGIRQNVSFSPGATYQLSLCGAFLNTVQPNARLRVRATNGNIISQGSYLPCALPNCEEIFLTPILGTSWNTYTAPLWTPQNPYDNLVVTVWNNSNANNGDFVSWARVDDICIRPIQTGEPLQPNVLLFPNPATDQINLAFDAPLPATATVRVLDMTGRICLRRIELPAGTELTSLDISGLTDGMYLADIEIRGVAALRKRFVVHQGGVQVQER